MDQMKRLVYPQLVEEETQTGWSKATIDYVISNPSKIYQSIRGIAKSQGKFLPMADVEDIYANLIDYLFKSDDYNIDKAYSSENIVTFEGYVRSCTKFCVIRYVTNLRKEEERKVSEHTVDENGKELSIFDTIADNSGKGQPDVDCSLDDTCKNFLCDRYSYGPDIFMLWFIRLQTIINNKQECYKDILDVLGISKLDMKEMEEHTINDGPMLSLAKAITTVGLEEASNIIERYVYASKKIREVIELF